MTISLTRRNMLGLLGATATVPLVPRFAIAAAPFTDVENAGYYRFELGNYEITALSDGTLALPMATIYQGEPQPELQRRLDQNFLGLEPHASVNAFLVNDGHRLVLIDAGSGNFFGPSAGKLLQTLRNSGYEAGQIDAVVLTHIHTDHSGGLTVDGAIQFPDAELYVVDRELRYWIEEPAPSSASEGLLNWRREAESSLRPYLDAGRIRTFEAGSSPLPGFGSISQPGHTPGHSAIVLEGPNGPHIVFWGDIVHGDYIQFDDPEISVSFDVNAEAAIETRERVLEAADKAGYLVAGAHLPFPGIGRVTRDETLFRFVPQNYVL